MPPGASPARITVTSPALSVSAAWLTVADNEPDRAMGWARSVSAGWPSTFSLACAMGWARSVSLGCPSVLLLTRVIGCARSVSEGCPSALSLVCAMGCARSVSAGCPSRRFFGAQAIGCARSVSETCPTATVCPPAAGALKSSSNHFWIIRLTAYHQLRTSSSLKWPSSSESSKVRSRCADPGAASLKDTIQTPAVVELVAVNCSL